MTRDSSNQRETRLSDRECVLVQFINERLKPVQVGFQAWLTDKEKIPNIEDIVAKEVIIKWPQNVDIVCAKSMERRLKNQENWDDLVVKVISVGEWTEMCHQANNIKKFGVANPTKEQRRAFCQKRASDSSTGSSGDDDSDGDNRNVTNNKDGNNKTTKGAVKQDHHDETRRRQKKNTATTKPNAELVAKLAGLNRRERSVEPPVIEDNIDDDVDDDVDDDDINMFKWSKAKLIDKVQMLQVENKRLRQDNARLRALRAVNEDLQKITDASSEIRRQMKRLKEEIVSLHVKPSVRTNGPDAAFKSNARQEASGSRPTAVNISRTAAPVRNATKAQGDDDNASRTKSGTAPSVAPSPVGVGAAPSPVGDPTVTEEISDVMPVTEVVARPTTIDDGRTNGLDFGGRLVPLEKVARLDRTKGLSFFITSLMTIVFSKEEMATSSMTGTTSNFIKAKEQDATKKKVLDPLVKDAVIDYVLREMKVERSKENLRGIQKTMKTKLNNEYGAMMKKQKSLLKEAPANHSNGAVAPPAAVDNDAAHPLLEDSVPSPVP